MRTPTLLAALASLLVLSTPLAAQLTKAPPVKTKQPIKVETFAKGLVHPWGLAFLPDGRLLVTERPGRLRIVGKDGKLSAPLQGVPKVYASGQGGLLDVQLGPDFVTSGAVYLSYADPRDGSRNGTSVARGKLLAEGDGGRLEDVKVIFRQEPSYSSGQHFGSRLVFTRDGSLFVTLGDRYSARDEAQNPANHLGKLVRITPDGSPYAGNPKKPGWRPEIWSIGHRNVQGAVLNPATGKLWAIEHGARGGDEINIPEAGKNYGWPVISYGRNYDFTKIGIGTHKEGMAQPLYYWDPSIAPSGAAFYTGDRFPEWKGNLFVGALAGRALHRLVLDGEKIVGEEKLLADLGERIRDVRIGPDGALWLLTDNPQGRVLRLVPAS
jgi:aldose sugar dehydrogenase